MKLKLPPVVLVLLKQRGGNIDASLRATRAQLIKTCTEHKYQAHASVVAFEAAFGGLAIPDEGRKIKKNEPYWIFGAHACLVSGAHTAPRGGSKARKLVPVVYSPNDLIYYLDEKGRAYAEDTIEDSSASLYADNGTSLVCRIVIDDAFFNRSETSVEVQGLHGEALAKRFSLSLIAKASGNDIRYFSDAKGAVLVAEEIKNKRTRFASATKKPFNLLKQPVPSLLGKAPAEAAPFAGKANVRMVGEQRTSLPDFFDHLPELRELDASINHLKTLPESLWQVTQLTKLDLSFNPLTSLPDGIANLKSLNALVLRGCPISELPEALVGAKNLTKLIVTECKELNVDQALKVIARLPKLKELSLPLSTSLTSLAPLASLPLKSLYLNGLYMKHPDRLPSGLGQLKKLTDLRIEHADDIAQLPEEPEDVQPLRLLFAKKFTDEDIRNSARQQPEVLYLRAFVATLSKR